MAFDIIRLFDNTDVAKVMLKPTKAFPDGGYFYVSVEDAHLIQRWDAWLIKSNTKQKTQRVGIQTLLNKEKPVDLGLALTNEIYGYIPAYTDHYNGVPIDNTRKNIIPVTSQQNNRNSHSKGYSCASNRFTPNISVCRRQIHFPYCKTEAECCLTVYDLREDYYSDYDYSFMADRRGDLDILDLEYTGQISSEEATFRHVMRYAKDNAWYVYRYNLFDYFKSNGVAIPKFTTNEDGYMTHPITGQLLCPFHKEGFGQRKSM